MQKITNLLTERVVNIFNNKEELKKYIDVIWDILQQTYKPLGGFATAKTKEELINKTDIAKLIRKNNKIVAVALYKDKGGRKAIAKGHDGTSLGISGVKMIYLEDIKFKRSWGEFSGPAERYQIKNGAIPIPNKFASEILGKEILDLNKDGVHYTRMIGGNPHEKIMFGNIKK